MGYWFPPPPTVFNPTVRPFNWHAEGDGAYPEPEDEAFYGVGRGTSPVPPIYDTNVGAWVAPPGCPENIGDETKGPWKNYGDLVCVGGYGAGFNFKDKSPADRLDYYRKMIALRTPAISYLPFAGDPEGGGLAPDVATDAGVWINYFDCSDSSQPKRKAVFYPGDGKSDPTVRQWNPDSGEWEDEGFDWDKDLPKIFQGALSVIGTVGAIAISFVTVDPAVLGAWAGMMGQLSQAARPGGKIDPFAVMQEIIKDTNALPGIGQMFSSDAMKNSVAASLYDSARKIADYAKNFEQKIETFFSSFSQAISGNFALIPKIDPSTVARLFAHDIPPELVAALGPPATAPLTAVHHAIDAFLLQGEIPFQSRRKLVPFTGSDVGQIANWRVTFDLMFASLSATQEVVVRDPREYADQAADPGATMTVAQVMAHLKQSAASAQGMVSFWQIAKTLPASPVKQGQPPPAPNAAATPKPVTAGQAAIGLTVAAVLAKLLFF